MLSSIAYKYIKGDRLTKEEHSEAKKFLETPGDTPTLCMQKALVEQALAKKKSLNVEERKRAVANCGISVVIEEEAVSGLEATVAHFRDKGKKALATETATLCKTVYSLKNSLNKYPSLVRPLRSRMEALVKTGASSKEELSLDLALERRTRYLLDANPTVKRAYEKGGKKDVGPLKLLSPNLAKEMRLDPELEDKIKNKKFGRCNQDFLQLLSNDLNVSVDMKRDMCRALLQLIAPSLKTRISRFETSVETWDADAIFYLRNPNLSKIEDEIGYIVHLLEQEGTQAGEKALPARPGEGMQNYRDVTPGLLNQLVIMHAVLSTISDLTFQ